MARAPHTFSGDTLSVFAGNDLHTIPKEHPGYAELVIYLGENEDHDDIHILDLIDLKSMLSRLTAGKVVVVGDTVLYNGLPIHTTCTDKLLAMLDAGENAGPWANFIDNVMRNPTERARECLYDFLAHNDTPLTEDGCFLAWKYVTAEFKDAYTQTYDNSPGKTVEMLRKDVDDDPDRTCSSGLHCCGSSYLGGYSSNAKVVKVKVNPRDVVAVPREYQFNKMRVCRYVVLEEVFSDEEIATVDKEHVSKDVSQTEVYIADEVKDLPTYKTSAEFNAVWARVSDDPEEGDLVAAKDGYLIGVLTDRSEDYDEGEWCEDDDGEMVEDEDDRQYYTIYTVDWQNGLQTTFYQSEGDLSPLTSVVSITTAPEEDDDPTLGEVLDGSATMTDELMTAVKEANTVHVTDDMIDGPPIFTREGRTYTAEFLKEEVERLGGQRAFMREHGVPRSTLQGWMSQI